MSLICNPDIKNKSETTIKLAEYYSKIRRGISGRRCAPVMWLYAGLCSRVPECKAWWQKLSSFIPSLRQDYCLIAHRCVLRCKPHTVASFSCARKQSSNTRTCMCCLIQEWGWICTLICIQLQIHTSFNYCRIEILLSAACVYIIRRWFFL